MQDPASFDLSDTVMPILIDNLITVMISCYYYINKTHKMSTNLPAHPSFPYRSVTLRDLYYCIESFFIPGYIPSFHVLELALHQD